MQATFKVAMYQVYWGSKVSFAFCQEVIRICVGFGWKPEQVNYLMACMAFESAETFDPSIRNGAGSGAVGLIQFMPNTAISMGTTADALSRMPPVSQLDYVRRYFLPYKDKIKTLADTYMAIFMPKYIGWDEQSVIFCSPGVTYRQNAGLDADKDGVVTKGEIAKLVAAKFTKGQQFIRTIP